MQTRTITILSVIFVAVLITSAVVYVRKPNSHAGDDPLTLHDVTADSVRSISLTTIEATNTLERRAGNWYLNESVVDTTAIDSLLAGVNSARQDLVSRKGRAVDQYGLSRDRSTTITFLVDDTERSYDVGATDYKSGGVYVTRTDDDSVYLVHGTTLGEFVKEDVHSWLEATSTDATNTPPGA